MKPFHRLQFDLIFLMPTGENGEIGVMTAICVNTKYPFLRNITSRESTYLAELMLDIILDAGVVPAVWQSDNEFCNLAFEELCSLLGGNQLFSTALNPKAQGIYQQYLLKLKLLEQEYAEEMTLVSTLRCTMELK